MTKSLKKIAAKKELAAILEKLLSDLGCSPASLSVLFTDDKEMRQINSDYRKKDKPTDVLSFASLDANLPQALQSEETLLGDLVISVDTLLRQAKEYKVSPKEELCRLLVHGTLHLLGYDHEGVGKLKAQQMRRKEAVLLAGLLSA